MLRLQYIKGWLVGASVLAFATGLYAQSQGGDLPALAAPTNLSSAEMKEKAYDSLKQIDADIVSVRALHQKAKKEKDVLKANCILDKAKQLNGLNKLSESAYTEFLAAMGQKQAEEMTHRLSVLTIAAEKSRGLKDEAEACVGEEINYLGPLDVGVGAPSIPDDPTQDDWFDGWDFEPPTDASATS